MTKKPGKSNGSLILVPPKSPIEVKSFPKEQLDEATTFYVQKRHELGWGLDFEIDDWEKLKASKGHQG